MPPPRQCQSNRRQEADCPDYVAPISPPPAKKDVLSAKFDGSQCRERESGYSGMGSTVSRWLRAAASDIRPRRAASRPNASYDDEVAVRIAAERDGLHRALAGLR